MTGRPSRRLRLRLLSAAVAALLAAALLAAWLVPPLLDWDRYRGTVAAIASAGLGRPVRIDGPIQLSLLPQATLRARDVALADTGDGARASAREIRLRVALGPLLAGRVEPLELALYRPSLVLPWPVGVAAPANLPAGLRARVEGGTLTIGGFAITQVGGDLAVDPATGTLSANGLATAMGRPWRMTGRLGRAGADGSATVEVSLDGQGPAVGTGAALSGQLAADGTLKGRVTGRGPDLSLVFAAPALPWRADGDLAASGGLVVADALELGIGGAPARGAVALRLLPRPRLDVALATSRLDLDGWLPPLLQGHAALPTAIDLQAETAALSGGALHRLRAGFEVATDGVALRELDATLPGDAALHLAGTLAGGRFSGDARLTAPDLRQTLAWLRPHAPGLVDALPHGALRTAEATAAIVADAGTLALHDLRGSVDGAPLTGSMALRGGPLPALVADLQVTGPVLDPFLPAGTDLAPLRARLAGFDANLVIDAIRPRVQGSALERLALAARVEAGALEIGYATLAGPGIAASLSGTLAPDGRIAEARLDLTLGQSEWLAARLPDRLAFARPLLRGPGTLAAVVSGLPASLSVAATGAVADARLQVNGRADLPGRHWLGDVSVQHPGAVRLLWSLGAGAVADWLGDGSLSAKAAVDWSADRLALAGLDVSAGSLRAGGDLTLAGLTGAVPVLSGAVMADTLPLPPLRWHATDPLGVGLLHAVNGTVTVRAGRVLTGLTPLLEEAAARVSLAGGALLVDGLTARLSGGVLAAQAGLDAGAPPRLSLRGRLTGAALGDGLTGAPLDVVGGVADASVDLSGTGYSPAGLLASLAGPVHATVRDGTLAGLDAGRVLALLGAPSPAAAPAVAEALRSGATPFTRLDLDGTFAAGTLTLDRGAITAPAGVIAVTGSADAPGAAVALRLALRPALDGAPTLGLRLIGPVDAPSRTPELADLARWLAR